MFIIWVLSLYEYYMIIIIIVVVVVYLLYGDLLLVLLLAQDMWAAAGLPGQDSGLLH